MDQEVEVKVKMLDLPEDLLSCPPSYSELGLATEAKKANTNSSGQMIVRQIQPSRYYCLAILALFCNPLLGGVALFLSSASNTSYKEGNIKQARKHGSASMILSALSIVVGLFTIAFFTSLLIEYYAQPNSRGYFDTHHRPCRAATTLNTCMENTNCNWRYSQCEYNDPSTGFKGCTIHNAANTCQREKECTWAKRIVWDSDRGQTIQAKRAYDKTGCYPVSCKWDIYRRKCMSRRHYTPSTTTTTATEDKCRRYRTKFACATNPSPRICAWQKQYDAAMDRSSRKHNDDDDGNGGKTRFRRGGGYHHRRGGYHHRNYHVTDGKFRWRYNCKLLNCRWSPDAKRCYNASPKQWCPRYTTKSRSIPTPSCNNAGFLKCTFLPKCRWVTRTMFDGYCEKAPTTSATTADLITPTPLSTAISNGKCRLFIPRTKCIKIETCEWSSLFSKDNGTGLHDFIGYCRKKAVITAFESTIDTDTTTAKPPRQDKATTTKALSESTITTHTVSKTAYCWGIKSRDGCLKQSDYCQWRQLGNHCYPRKVDKIRNDGIFEEPAQAVKRHTTAAHVKTSTATPKPNRCSQYHLMQCESQGALKLCYWNRFQGKCLPFNDCSVNTSEANCVSQAFCHWNRFSKTCYSW